jgi:hypothetical protein
MEAIVTVNAPKQNPWSNGVLISLQGDCTNLRVLQGELEEIKKMINSDINKIGLALHLVDIKIEFK